jgi:hypothetical protein
MKNLALAFSVIILSLLFVFSCDKEELKEVKEEVKQETDVGFREREKHLFYVAWDGNGRTKHDCDKFGMCNVVSCGFCCTENGEIVPCNNSTNSSQNIYNTGIVSVDVGTGEGNLTYKLNPNDAQQNDAINNQLTYYIDEDFYIDNVKILEGEYPYDASVGDYGGYIVPVVEI